MAADAKQYFDGHGLHLVPALTLRQSRRLTFTSGGTARIENMSSDGKHAPGTTNYRNETAEMIFSFQSQVFRDTAGVNIS